MKKCLASLALGLSLLATTAIAPAQDKTPVPPGGIVVSPPPQSPPGITSAPSPGFPGVESADILKQNQAERTQVQPGNAAPTWRVVKEGTTNYSSLPALDAGVLIQPKAQFPGQMPKPDVDYIGGLSPPISIPQKSSGQNPRSTVGTITEIYDYLRVLFARTGQGHCPQCDRPITAQTREQIIARILAMPAGTQFAVLAPVIRGQKGEYRDLFEDLRKQGFVRARVDGSFVSLTDDLSLDRTSARGAFARARRSGGVGAARAWASRRGGGRATRAGGVRGTPRRPPSRQGSPAAAGASRARPGRCHPRRRRRPHRATASACWPRR